MKICVVTHFGFEILLQDRDLALLTEEGQVAFLMAPGFKMSHYQELLVGGNRVAVRVTGLRLKIAHGKIRV